MIFRFIECHLWLDCMFRRASSRLRDICFSKWSDSIFEFTLENILAYLDFFVQYINRKDLETQEYQPMRFRNILNYNIGNYPKFQDPAIYFRNSTHLLHFWNQHNSRHRTNQFNKMNCKPTLPPLFGKQEVGIRRVKKHFPRYGVPI